MIAIAEQEFKAKKQVTQKLTRDGLVTEGSGSTENPGMKKRTKVPERFRDPEPSSAPVELPETTLQFGAGGPGVYRLEKKREVMDAHRRISPQKRIMRYQEKHASTLKPTKGRTSTSATAEKKQRRPEVSAERQRDVLAKRQTEGVFRSEKPKGLFEKPSETLAKTRTDVHIKTTSEDSPRKSEVTPTRSPSSAVSKPEVEETASRDKEDVIPSTWEEEFSPHEMPVEWVLPAAVGLRFGSESPLAQKRQSEVKETRESVSHEAEKPPSKDRVSAGDGTKSAEKRVTERRKREVSERSKEKTAQSSKRSRLSEHSKRLEGLKEQSVRAGKRVVKSGKRASQKAFSSSQSQAADTLMHEYSVYDYKCAFEDREEGRAVVRQELESGNLRNIQEGLLPIIQDADSPEYAQCAAALMEKMETVEANLGLAVPEKGESISYYVAESMAYPVLGQYAETDSLASAVSCYEALPDSALSGGKGIGATLESEDGVRTDVPLMINGQMQKEHLENGLFAKSEVLKEAFSGLEKMMPSKETPELGKGTKGERSL